MGERFIKMHGLGNDFVVLDHLESPRELSPQEARFWADRRRGVGCDQVVQLLPGVEGGDAQMRIYNPDGSRAEMCGNAMRCVGLYLHEQRGMAAALAVETLAGIMRPQVTSALAITVDMGRPQWAGRAIPLDQDGEMIDAPLEVGGQSYRMTALSMGNPHGVVRVADAEGFELAKVGPLVEHHALFPNRINFEVVQVLSRSRIRMRVWERGAGITPACGTGACAAAVACMRQGWVERDCTVVLDGGELQIVWLESDRVMMSGPATEVFRGELVGLPAGF
ncbi:diaminopimelate epimerase [Magnetococcus marinus MC-1]|uniref:Diaminopimelate epimerase n=1 Tax=Magnetococcus marinus (strain ATCC BAA-1437 / JCM 17883 / MC-1) TaxID=156889 RepID=DAPF_MAGMM|nr:diaminopimelate epimerase [Magnetococcus marinus]A0LE31.1 RecName: Full=Diaminopimelate epimerase; Short=DAP epimerase; AltName: Full=PLP-independent amino acid racemase [Magnetococcus marinus MC-1]ABK46224.1 diaminopimelate epimerase [Magnetococcus marinus MC-1]